MRRGYSKARSQLSTAHQAARHKRCCSSPSVVAYRAMPFLLSLRCADPYKLCLWRVAVRRRPLQVPVLSLPWECSNEVLQFFDNHVKTALATLNQQGASPSTPTPDPNQPVDTQNLTVDRVYRRLVLPLLLQMRAILLDAPYHSLVEVCARLAPTLHGCEMPRCLGLLGEVIRGNNDINEDLLAPTGLFAGPSTRPHQFLQSTHDSIGPVTTSTVRQDSVDSVYDAALSGSFAVQSPPAVAGSPPAPTAASPSAVAAGLLNLSREGTRLSSGLASVTEVRVCLTQHAANPCVSTSVI